MKRFKNNPWRLACALLALALLLTPCAPARASVWDWFSEDSEEEDDAPLAASDDIWLPSPTPAPAIEAAEMADDGWLRVYLRSLGKPEQLHLTLSGSYAVEGDSGFRFERNTPVTLSAADGEVWLSVGGLTVDMGGALTLTRHAAEGENGIYIEESEKPTLYCGDLTVSAEGAVLKAVLRIQIEEYLYGVVAYEMSDSFPIEALKAQAVAARTYAMQRKWAAGARDYDLVDTTADQVFKGYDAAYTHVVQAVDETRGVVCAYGGGFATCYYTASNGGQTALPSQIWGKDAVGDAYLAMVDDPYDLENPRCLANALTFTAACEGSATLRKLLLNALEPEMAKRGIAAEDWLFEAIEAIEPVNPRFEGSYMYDGLAFDLRVRVVESALASPTPEPTDTPAPTPSEAPESSESPAPSAFAEPEAEADEAATAGEAPEATAEATEAVPSTTPAEAPTQAPTPAAAPAPEKWVTLEEPCRVVLDVYEDIKDQLSLGLNGTDCELISVETFEDASGRAESFTITMRRFGHGVGMSQRGAQYMAGQYGRGWMDIIAFYYPGVTLQRMDWPDAELTDLDALPATVGAARPRPTPGPTPAPLPELQAGEYYATVTATSLNVRETPSTAARILDVLEKGRRLIVSGEPDADGWVPVHTAELGGYVKLEYLQR